MTKLTKQEKNDLCEYDYLIIPNNENINLRFFNNYFDLAYEDDHFLAIFNEADGMYGNGGYVCQPIKILDTTIVDNGEYLTYDHAVCDYGYFKKLKKVSIKDIRKNKCLLHYIRHMLARYLNDITYDEFYCEQMNFKNKKDKWDYCIDEANSIIKQCL